ncbi:flagellar assembly protein FliO [Candidatus Gastranaerophilus sp. (ex Termes propinquus)]|nr:flagellar assembly protein FliO [Candidatus Gastranaerophilus sp. (ex Termes propinquus)]
MSGYIAAFGVYTLAMIGVLFIAFFIWKKSMLTNIKGSKNTLKAEEVLPLGGRKALYIIRAGAERFLIATDAERTTFLTKLEVGQNMAQVLSTQNELDFNLDAIDALKSQEDKPVMRNLLKELTGKGN